LKYEAILYEIFSSLLLIILIGPNAPQFLFLLTLFSHSYSGTVLLNLSSVKWSLLQSFLICLTGLSYP